MSFMSFSILSVSSVLLREQTRSIKLEIHLLKDALNMNVSRKEKERQSGKKPKTFVQPKIHQALQFHQIHFFQVFIFPGVMLMIMFGHTIQ